MALADAGWADEQHVLLSVDKHASGEVDDPNLDLSELFADIPAGVIQPGSGENVPLLEAQFVFRLARTQADCGRCDHYRTHQADAERYQ